MIKRRDFITLLGGAAALWPLPLSAQQPVKVPQIGYLGFGSASAWANRVEAMRVGLRELGYVEGKNIVIEFRWAERADQLRELAAELVRMNVDVIFATSSTEVEAARQATKTIPIVFATHADPVGVGHVASLRRPGGNITGLSMVLTELATKELAMLKEAVPHATRIGVLLTSTLPTYAVLKQAVVGAGEKLGVQLQIVPVRTAEDYDGAFEIMARERVGSLLAVASPLITSQRKLLAELALRYRLPAMFGTKDNVVAGGLMSYAPDLADLTRRAATYIDKILKGAKPADMPVDQASKYQLVINLKTAKALGLELPAQLLALADEVIE
jgi:putative tryptophan/tyrosine transport system substrate-binding protein